VARRAGLDVGNGIPFLKKPLTDIFYMVARKHQFQRNYTFIFVRLALNGAGSVCLPALSYSV
jgi:hypothetical protein